MGVIRYIDFNPLQRSNWGGEGGREGGREGGGKDSNNFFAYEHS